MKKFRKLAVLAGLAGLMAMPAAAADVSYTTVLSGSVVSVAPVGATVKEGDVLPVTEGKLPNSYYYTLGNAYAMSANYTFRECLTSKEGTVKEIKETPKGFFVTVCFDE